MKIKPIEIKSSDMQNGLRIELVGYPQTKNYGLPYVRFETIYGQYLGSLDLRQVRRLLKFCEKALGEKQ